MRKRENNFSIPTTEKLDIEFSLSNGNILEINKNTGDNSLNVKAKSMGQVALTITAKKSGTQDIVLDNITYQITVAFSINEQIATNDNPNVRMLRLFREQDASDERNNRKALIMTYDEDNSGSPTTYIAFGAGADKPEELKYLNLIFGDARTITPNIEWQSGNEDIISINPTFQVDGETRGCIIAEGAGRTTLSVTWQDGTMTYQDEIYVFVRPKITIDGENVGTNSQDGNGSNPLQVTNGTKISVSVKSQANQLVSISDKLAWVIAKPDEGNIVLVRDSLGNSTKDYENEANLEWLPSEGCYRVNAKAGTYFIQFFVVGTYKDFNTAIDADYCQCKPVSVINGVYVGSEFKNYDGKYVSLNVGSQFNFPKAFSITDDTFDKYFDVTITGVTNPTGGTDIISFVSGQLQKIITANRSGTVTIKVTANSNVNASELRDIMPNEAVNITIVITDTFDTFTLNYSNVEMSVGSELSLWGVLASGSDVGSDEVEYQWSTEDTDNCIEINNTVRDHAIVKALKTTKSGPVNVMLSRTQNGVTLVATCSIRINATTTSFHIVPSELTMKIGETQTITTDLKDPCTLLWLSSDTSVATVVSSPETTTPSAQVTAKKTGSAILIAINTANNVYATCMITVEQPVTELEIGIAGKKISNPYTVELSQEFVFMEALYKPNDATEKDFKWESSDNTVATVDSTGKITLIKEGTTTITVSSRNASAIVTLNVITKSDDPSVIKPLFSDYNYNNPITDDEAVIYGNGATLTIGNTKVNNKVFTAYTDILGSYKYTVNNKGIVKASIGKVIVGITKSATKPEVNNKNKITDTSASKIARAKIKNGQITVTAIGKESGLVYLWVIDTGNKGMSAYCPINVKMAPKKLEVQDTSNKTLKNIKLENGKSLDVHIAGIVSGTTKTDDCTYTAVVDSKYQGYVQVSPNENSGKDFTIKAIGLKNNKDTKVTITFKCNQNNKKINFSVTITK